SNTQQHHTPPPTHLRMLSPRCGSCTEVEQESNQPPPHPHFKGSRSARVPHSARSQHGHTHTHTRTHTHTQTHTHTYTHTYTHTHTHTHTPLGGAEFLLKSTTISTVFKALSSR